MSKLITILLTTLLGLAIWQAAIVILEPPSFILPSPWKVANTLVSSAGLIYENALVTISEVLLGLALGTTLGVASAIQLALSPALRRMTLPLLVFSQAIPVFALAPLLTLWFGYGIGSKIVMTVLIIYFPVTSAFLDGLTRTDRDLIHLAQNMNGTKWSIMREIRIPNALPSLGSGLRLAAVYAPIGAIIGEWVGASKGLGYLMLLANGRAKTDLMFASLIVLAVLTVILHAGVGLLADKLDRYANGQD